jgi:PhnB protein
MAENVSPIPEGYHTVTPYLIATDAPGLIEFLQRAFGAALLSRHDAPDGSVMHAEVQLGDSRIMIGQSNEEWPPVRPMLHLYMAEVDEVHAKALEAGATSLRDPEDQFFGDRSGGVLDPYGNQWWIATRMEEVSPEEMERRLQASRDAAPE